MDRTGRAPFPAHPWHALLAPLPAGAVPKRKPVAPPEILARPEGAAIAGWENLIVEVSAGAAGHRITMVVLDAGGQPISASDGVLYQREAAEGTGGDTEYCHESVGGRLEADGTFRGTRWHSVTVMTADGNEIRREATPSEPSPEDVAALKALVTELLRRAPGRECER